MKTYFGVITGALLCLSGCSHSWVGPAGGHPEKALQHCKQQGESVYPVKNEVVYKHWSLQGSPEDADKKKKTGHHRSQRETYSGDIESDITDVNKATREDYIRTCMRSEGWTRHRTWFWQ